jgi:L-lactate dehydrogenase complex protein LldG
MTAMTDTVRNDILTRLKNAPRTDRPNRPVLPDLPFIAMSDEERIEALVRHLTEQTAQVHRAGSMESLLDALETVIGTESLSRIILSAEEDITRLGLHNRFEGKNVAFVNVSDFGSPEAYKDAVFSVDAALTSVDFAVAESGTLVIRHSAENARLLSLAPVHHLALVPVSRIVPVYESIDTSTLPAQLTFITGPSMTADIQATPFRGMHGPGKLTVFILG